MVSQTLIVNLWGEIKVPVVAFNSIFTASVSMQGLCGRRWVIMFGVKCTDFHVKLRLHIWARKNVYAVRAYNHLLEFKGELEIWQCTSFKNN